MSRLGGAASGAVGGAAAGSVLGPWGTAAGAVIGGVGGWLLGAGPSDAEIAAQQAQAAARNDATQLAANAAHGNGPTQAQLLLQRGLGQQNDLAFSQAKGVAGASPALAATLASNAGAMNSEAALNQSAQLRAQEMNDARAQYLAATGANVDQAQTRDAAQTAQSNMQSQFNTQLFNSAIGGAAQAGGMMAGAGQPAAAQPAQPIIAPKPAATPIDWSGGGRYNKDGSPVLA